MRKIQLLLTVLSIGGIGDASYLTYEHYSRTIPPCALHSFLADCGKVLTSQYSTMGNIPVAVFGIIFYTIILGISLYSLKFPAGKKWHIFLLFVATVGCISSLYFVFLQLAVIKAICLYCMISALNTFIIFLSVFYLFLLSRTKLFSHSIL